MIDVTIIPHELKVIGQKWGNFTKGLEADLQSGAAIELATLAPGGEALREDAIALCETAIKGAQALIAIGDNAGFKARLQRLGSDLTMLEHSSEKHTISYYITAFETIFHDLFGKSE